MVAEFPRLAVVVATKVKKARTLRLDW